MGETDSFTLPEATGGTGAKTYSLSGQPTGVTFNANTRVVSVTTPAIVAQTTVTYTVTDSAGTPNTTTLTFNITVTAAQSQTEVQSLAVTFPSATTALLTWSQPTNLGGGSPLESYEVNPNNSAYTDTKSVSGRYLVSGLTRGSNQTFSVRAKRADGTTGSAVTVTKRTPIASLHNALFFRDCRNLEGKGSRVTEHGNSSNILRAAADNDLETYTDETDLAIDISDGTNPTRVDAIMTITEGVASHVGVATGGVGTGWTTRTIPTTIKNWEGTNVSTTVDNKQHDLYLLDTHFTATSVRVTFTGSNIRIYGIYLLEFGVEINCNGDMTEISPDFVDRNFVLHQQADGGVIRETGRGGRQKFEIDFTAKFCGRTNRDTKC